MKKLTMMVTCLLALATLGCGPNLDTDDKTACRSEADCLDGFMCIDEVCVDDAMTNNTSNNVVVIDDIETIDDYNRAAWNAVCDAVFECPNEMTLGLILFWYGRYASAAECKASYEVDRAAFRSDFLRGSELADAIADGRIEFSGDAAATCLQDWAAAVCAADFEGDETPDFDSCPGVMTPKQDLDEPCAFRQECRSGLLCDAFAQETCGGVCVTDNGRTSCGGVNCAVTEYCDISDPQSPQCRSSKADGEPCAPTECGPDSICFGGEFDGPLGVCTALRSLDEGEECDDIDMCKPGLYCHWAVDDELGTCVTLAFDRTAGEPCEPGHFCEPGLACVPDGDDLTKFVCGTQLAAGSRCAGDSQCEPGLHCDGWLSYEPGSEGVCAEPSLTTGAECNWSMECASGICDYRGIVDYQVCVSTEPVCEI